MISDASIEQVKDVLISDVLRHYLSLKKNGSNYFASCPFHHEKTSSFCVNDTKEIYKCFGCGASGDAINFVMKIENKTFVDAIETIAKKCGIAIEYEDRIWSDEEKQKMSAAQLQETVLNFVIPFYQKQLFILPAEHPVKQFLYNRGFNDDIIIDWQLGWAGTDWHYITPQLINKEWFEPANKLGIIKRSQDNRNYDGYRSRITIPIKNIQGRYTGLAGRFIEVDETDKGKDLPKYINPSDCELYNKSTVLFGIDRAAKAISQKKHAVLVEGYFDVISPHKIGFENVVGTCGTSFTKKQMQLIKKHTSHLVLMRDNDKAGQQANSKQLPDLLKEGFKVELVKYEQKDPDEWVQSLNPINGEEVAFPLTVDAVINRAAELWKDCNQIHELAAAKRAILELVCCISNDILRNYYIDHFCKLYSWKGTDTKKEIALILDSTAKEDSEAENAGMQLPSWLSQEEKDQFLMNGYVPVNKKVKGRPLVGYFTFQAGGMKTEITNFIVTPLFHIYAGIESRFLLQINNGYRNAVLDIPARCIPSVDQFQANTVAEGNFIIFGAKPQWLRVASDLLQKFPRCIEIRSLGWQSHLFFAWVDKIFIPGDGLKDLDNWGIIKIKEENFLIPASCEAYKQLRHTGDDPFENDRHLTFKVSPVTFSQWSMKMFRVYKQQGVIGIAGLIMSLFRDVVFDVDNNCPHLYAFGEPSSGKSKWAESITAPFFYKRSAFNLNSGTDFAFFSYMQRYTNCPAHLNEFEIEVIRPEWFEAIKGIYDGEGREKGKQNAGIGGRNRTEIMKVRSVLILTGQKLITANDNSLVTRSLIEGFSLRDDLSEEDKQEYTQLKDWEGQGLSSMLLELLKHREHIAAVYKDSVNDQLSHWRKEKKDARGLNQRILQNYAHLATGYNIFSKLISLPQTAEEFTDYCYKQARYWSQFIRNSDTLSEFWRTFEFLVSEQIVHQGWDYKIEELTEVRLKINREEDQLRTFDKPVKVLFLRLNNVHKLFQTAYRNRTGREAMSIDNMLHYFSSRKYYVGAIKNKTFKRFVTVTENKPVGLNELYATTEKRLQEQKTSCYAFLYDELNVEIEMVDESSS